MSEKALPRYDYINHIGENDTWRVKIRDKQTGKLVEVGKPIITHAAVERLAHVYGVKVVRYEWLKTDLDDCLVMIEVTGYWDDDRVTPEVGECNNMSAGEVGSKYPHSMAWKRGFDRAVLAHLGIDAYSSEEAEDFVTGERIYGKGPATANNNTVSKAQKRASKASTTVTETPKPSGGDKRIEDSQKAAITKSINLLQVRGMDLTLESFLEEHFGGKGLDDFTFAEGAKAIDIINGLIANS